MYDTDGNELPFLIDSSNKSTQSFDLLEIENPFLEGKLNLEGESRTYKSLGAADELLVEELTITESHVLRYLENKIKKETYDHFTGQSTIEYLPFEEKVTQNNSDLFSAVDSFHEELDGFSGEINWTGLEDMENLQNAEFIQVNSSWFLSMDATGTLDFSEQGLVATAPVDLSVSLDISYPGCLPISTEWGDKNAALIIFLMTGNFAVDSFWIDLTQFGAIPYGQDPWAKFIGFSIDLDFTGNAYFLKELGSYLLNMKGTISFPSEISMLYDGEYFQVPLPTQSIPTFYFQLSLQDNNFGDFTKNFSIPTNSSPISSDILQSWTWNGAFPWVYDHSSQSWYYYYNNDTGYFVYHSNLNNWFKFNISTGEWSQTSF
ncbi:MAG: hypothetical protein VW576_09395 [Opitutae bacterium]